MSKVLIVRHGETTWNREGRMQGWAPTPLTERGVEQARKAGEYISDHYDVSRIVSSDLIRAIETAEEINEFIEVEIEEDIRWREQDFGVYQGLTPTEFQERVEENSPTKPLKDGESISGVRKRALNGLESLRKTNETVVVVSHTGPIMQILGENAGVGFFEAYDVCDLSNTSITEVEVNENGDFTIVKANTTEHLPEEIETAN